MTLKMPVPKAAEAVEVKKGRTGVSRGFSLFDLTDDRFKHELLEKAVALAEAEGADAEGAMQKAMEAVDNLTKDKVIAYGLRILQWEAEAEVIEKEEKRQAKRKKARLNMAENLRKRLVFLMERDGRLDEQFKDEKADVGFKMYPVLEADLEKLPKEWVEVETPAPVYRVKDTNLLKKAAKNAENDYLLRLEQLQAEGKTAIEAQAEARKLLIPGASIKPNWKVTIK